MLRKMKISSNIKAAVVLIVTENLTVIRSLVKSAKSFLCRSGRALRNARWQDRKKPV